MDLMKQTEETAQFAKLSLAATEKPAAESKKTATSDKAKAVIDSFTEEATETANKILDKHGIAGEPKNTTSIAQVKTIKDEPKKDNKTTAKVNTA